MDKLMVPFALIRSLAEQSYYSRWNSLISHLNQIKELLYVPGEPRPYCYSWQTREHEYWLQPFLLTLYDHLTEAGIRVIMDLKPKDDFIKEYGRRRNYVILIGTESLLLRYYSDTNNIERKIISILNKKIIEDHETYGYSRVSPLLLSGIEETAFPYIQYEENSRRS